MKKLLLSFGILASAIFANADTLYTLTSADAEDFSCNQYTESHTATIGDNTWTIINGSNNNRGWSNIRFGRKSAASCGYINTDFASEGVVNQVVISGQNAKTNATNNMKRAWVAASTTKEFTDSIVYEINVDDFLGAANQVWTITVDLPDAVEGMYYSIGFDMNATGNNGTFAVDKVEYNGTPAASSLLNAEVAFPAEAYSVVYGDEFDSPLATTLSDGVLVYKSSNEDVATVDATSGVVTILGSGVTTITASVDATDTYKAGSASYTLTVKNPQDIYSSAMGEDFMFDQAETYPWSHTTQYGIKGTAYISGAIEACEGIAYSPAIDLTKRENIVLNFDQCFNNYKIDNVMIDTDDFSGYAYLVVAEDNATSEFEWTELDAITAPEAFNWNFYANDPVSLDAYQGKVIRVGYKYVSTPECAGTWEVKNIKVTGDITSGITSVEAGNEAETYYNLQGVKINNPGKGLYIVVKGNKSTKRLF